MTRHSSTLAMLVGLLAASSFAQTPQKIVLTPAMATRLSPSDEGFPARLVDEQALVGDPAAGARASPVTSWGAQWAGKRMTAQLDLGQDFVITQVWLYDGSGGLTDPDRYQIIANATAGDQVLVSDRLTLYNTWVKFDFTPVTTRRLTVVTPTGYIGMNELVLYGYVPTPPPPPSAPAKLTLTPSMATRLSPSDEGFPARLVDEQTLVGDPAAGARASPVTSWGAQWAGKRMTAQLDLGQDFVITQVWLYDGSGGLNDPDRYQVIANATAGDQVLVNDKLNLYNTWAKFDFAPVTTRRLTVVTPTGYIGMNELVLYGYPSTGTPPPPPPTNRAPVLNGISNLTLNAGVAGAASLTATDADGDAIALSLSSASPPAFVSLVDNHNGTGAVNVSTASTAGTYALTVTATDSKGATDTKSFTLQVNAVTPPPPTGGVQTAIAKGLIAGSTWRTHLGYWEYLPAGYNPADTSVKYPVVFFFHGLGEIGNGSVADLQRLLGPTSPPGMLARNQLQPLLPQQVIVLSPQTSQTLWLANESAGFVQYALGLYGAKVDPKRIYLTGLSLGGAGPWDAINDIPGYANSSDQAQRELAALIALTRSQVAAIVPICAHATAADYRVLRGMPTWAHHGTGDGTVPYERTRMKMQQLAMEVNPDSNRPSSGVVTGYFNFTSSQWVWSAGLVAPPTGVPGEYQNLVFTVSNGAGHDTWSQAYTSAELWKWLLAQRRP